MIFLFIKIAGKKTKTTEICVSVNQILEKEILVNVNFSLTKVYQEQQFWCSLALKHTLQKI
jgi:hypothetical protein